MARCFADGYDLFFVLEGVWDWDFISPTPFFESSKKVVPEPSWLKSEQTCSNTRLG
jgi:hypothetical protein